MNYPDRSLAAIHAKRRGVLAFEVVATGEGWAIVTREDGPGAQYARTYAEDSTRDWIHHTEIGIDKIPVLVVNVPREELPNDIPDLFRVVPLCAETWEPERKKRAVIIAPGLDALAAFAPAVVAPRAENAPPVAPAHQRYTGARAIVAEVLADLPGASRKEIVAECVRRGLLPQTATASLSKVLLGR